MIFKENKFIGFHDPKEEPYGVFSNWYPCSFYVTGREYTSVEQYLMYQKAQALNDWDTMDKILAENDPVKLQRLGRSIKNYNEKIWGAKRPYALYVGVWNKFWQNLDLQDILLNRPLITHHDLVNDVMIAECSKSDKIYGIGLGLNDPRRFHTDCWTGLNLLGGALMYVRKELINKIVTERGEIYE